MLSTIGGRFEPIVINGGDMGPLLPYKSVTWVSSNPTVNTPDKPNMTLENLKLKGDVILLMDKILHQLIRYIFPWFTGFYTSKRWWSPDFWTINRFVQKDHFNGKYIFQPAIFRGYVNFPGSNMTGDLKDIPQLDVPHSKPSCSWNLLCPDVQVLREPSEHWNARCLTIAWHLGANHHHFGTKIVGGHFFRGI